MGKTDPAKPVVSLSARRAARVLAIQALYQFNQSDDQDFEYILKEFLDYRQKFNDLPAKDTDWELFSALFCRVNERRSDITEILISCLNERWSMDRLDSVLKAILYVGIAEVVYFLEIPVKISLDEYIEVAKLFFDKQEVSFVNGVLNVVARKSRKGELLEQE